MREGKVVDAFYQLSNLQMVNNPQIRCDCSYIIWNGLDNPKGAWNYLRTAPVFQLPCSWKLQEKKESPRITGNFQVHLIRRCLPVFSPSKCDLVIFGPNNVYEKFFLVI